MAAIGVYAAAAAQAQRAAFDERAGLAATTEPQAFQAEQHRRREVVVAHQRIDIAVGHAGHLIGLLAGRTDRGVARNPCRNWRSRTG